MPGLFLSSDCRRLLKNKKIVVLGDSVYRGMYKDIVLLLQNDRQMEPIELKTKGEDHFADDSLIYRTELTNGPEFTEIREYQSKDGYHLVMYYFITRVYNSRVERFLQDMEAEPPDVVIMNSCQWDLSRYRNEKENDEGQNAGSRKAYFENLNCLLTRMHAILKPSSILLWCTALPLASQIVGGFLRDNVKFNAEPLRVFILEGNYEAAQIVTSYGFDVLDLHYYMRSQVHHREKDGVHWSADAHRHITDLILTFLCDTWDIPLPASTVETLKRVEKQVGELALPHLSIEGKPNFLSCRVKRLEEMAKLGVVNPGI